MLGNLSSGTPNDKYTVGCNMSSSYGAPGKKKEERNNEKKWHKQNILAEKLANIKKNTKKGLLLDEGITA